MYNRTRVAKAVLASSFCFPLKTVSNLHLVKNGGHESCDQGRWMGLLALQGTGGNSCTSVKVQL